MNETDICSALIAMLKELSPSVDFDMGKAGQPLTELGYDSLDVAGLLLKIEERYDIQVSEQDAGRISSIDDAVKFIAAKTSSASV
jgi:acyl carrier protein